MPGAPLIDVIVPTMWRADRLRRVVRNAHDNTASANIVTLVAEGHDHATVQAARRLASRYPWVRLVVNERAANYAGAVNTAVMSSPAEWWFGGADDLNFHPGWDTACLAAGGRVVGTNDLFNVDVLAGLHATHYLVHRSYSDDGGTSDAGPGVALHEGYDHNYVDTEFVAVARARGEFRPCLDAVVEHLHFGAGKSVVDATYDRGQARVMADRDLFLARVAMWGPA